MFCCEQAVVIAEKMRSYFHRKDVAKEALKEFGSLPWEKQKSVVPELLDEHSGHSGATIRRSLELAGHFLSNHPQRVRIFHGSVIPIAGPEMYEHSVVA